MSVKLGQAAFAQIRLLVNDLTRKNAKATAAEVHSIVQENGHEAYVYFVRLLVSQVDFRDTSKAQQPKLHLLIPEVQRILEQENYSSTLCQILADVPVDEEFLHLFCKQLKLSLRHQLLVSLAVYTSSPSSVTQEEGAKFLQTKLTEVSAETVAHFGQPLVERILCVLQGKEPFESQRSLFHILCRSVFAEHTCPPTLASLLYCEGLEINSQPSYLDSQLNMAEFVSRLENNISPAAVLEELGYASTSSVAVLKDVLCSLPMVLTEVEVAHMLGMMARTFTGLGESVPLHSSQAHLAALENKGGDKAPTTWNLVHLVATLADMCPQLNWPLVIRRLDYPGFHITHQKGVVLIITVFRKACQAAFPMDAILCRWSNTAGQLSFLRHAVTCLADVFSFSSSSRAIPPVEGLPLPKAASPPLLHHWCSVDLIEVLMALAETEHHNAVRTILEFPLKHCPEMLLLGLVHCKGTGVAQTELCKMLLQTYTNNHPNSFPVLHRLWATHPLVVVRGLVDLYQKDPVANLGRVVDIGQELKALSHILDARPFNFALDVAALSARREFLHLEKWLLDRLAQHQDPFAKACLAFVRERTLAPKSPDATMPVEMTSVFFKCLNAHSSKFAGDTVNELKQLYSQCAQSNPRLNQEQAHNAVFDADIEEEANSYFQKIYTCQQSIQDVITMLKGFKSGKNQREQEIFACMIHNLFDEYRFFPRYPEKELKITGVLFGSLIQHQLVSCITLGIALRYVLEALRKPVRSNMFKFGITALEQFKVRLYEWPQYCSHILGIPTIRSVQPDIIEFIESAVHGPPVGQQGAVSTQFTPGSGGVTPASAPAGAVESMHHPAHTSLPPGSVTLDRRGSAERTVLVSNGGDKALPAAEMLAGTVNPVQGDTARQQYQNSYERQFAEASSSSPSSLDQNKPALSGQLYVTSAAVDSSSASDPPAASSLAPPSRSHSAPPKSDPVVTPGAASGGGVTPVGGGTFATSLNLDTLLASAEEATADDAVQDKIFFIFNNLSMQNQESKEKELKEILTPAVHAFLAQYLVVKRASIEPNFHNVYLAFLDRLKLAPLVAKVVATTLDNIRLLLKSEKITSSSSERSLLKNLGSWLGALTVAKNKPLLQRDLDLKELICDAFERGRLIAVIPFVAKILEACKSSKIFKPPNPWVMGLVSLLCELYTLRSLKLNLKFEIEVLCKNLELDIKEVKASAIIKDKEVQFRVNNPDWTFRDGDPGDMKVAPAPPRQPTPPPTSSPAIVPAQAPAAPTSQPVESAPVSTDSSGKPTSEASVTTDIPNLAMHVTINATLTLFQQQPQLARVVAPAVDRAIREIIAPVVERSVTIACITSRELILKDFAMEPDEGKMRKAAHLMVQNLAGSLALVTCKEPLRASIGNHIRSLLQSAGVDSQVLDSVASVVATENLDLGCAFIEKAAMDKAVRDIDESLSAAYSVRRSHREAGQSYFDMSIFNAGRYPSSLPEALRPVGVQSVHHQRVYEDFARARGTAPSSAAAASAAFTQAAGAGVVVGPAHPSGQAAGQPSSAVVPGHSRQSSTSEEGETYTTQQAVEQYVAIMTSLEAACQRHSSSASALADGEVRALVQSLAHTVLRSGSRDEVALAVAQKLFIRLYEESSVSNEVVIALLQVLRDLCKRLPKELTSWLVFSDPARKFNKTVTAALLNAAVVVVADVDTHFAKAMDSGRNASALQCCVHVIRACVLEARTVTASEVSSIMDVLSKIFTRASGNGGAAKNPELSGLGKLLEDVKQLNTADKKKEPVVSEEARSDPAGLREKAIALYEEWLRVLVSGDSQANFVLQVQKHGVLKDEELFARVVRVTSELTLQRYHQSTGNMDAQSASVDALATLAMLLLPLHADALSLGKPVVLTKILTTVASVLMNDHDINRVKFAQRPYSRFFTRLLAEVTASPHFNAEGAYFQALSGFASVLHTVQPTRVPAFAFAWLELVSHRLLMPKLLQIPGQRGWPYFHRLLIDALTFLEPYLRSADLGDAIRQLYKGLLRVLLVLLHDFSEFLCDYHFSLCNHTPPSCIQMRNLILSAFPRNTHLPDPFTPNLKVDLLPEIAQPPRILSNITAALVPNNLQASLDTYLASQGPPAFLADLPARLLLPQSEVASAGTKYSVQVINSLVLYVGRQTIQLSQGQPAIAQAAPMKLFHHLAKTLDTEGRYLFLNAIANQLRYPNNHTHYFSCVLLSLFSDASHEIVQEQITRVLLERLIVNRPHPWGLLITFIELIKNPRYNFWNHQFTRCAPEIEKLFESVARSCIVPQQPADAESKPAEGMSVMG